MTAPGSDVYNTAMATTEAVTLDVLKAGQSGAIDSRAAYMRRYQKYHVVDVERPAYRSFQTYLRDNPDVFHLFVRFARDAKAAGFPKYSMYSIVQRVRWHVEIETKSLDGFKFSNNHTPYYARLIMLHCPDLEDFFDIHELFGASTPKRRSKPWRDTSIRDETERE